MAGIGLSKCYAAVYSASGTTVSYSNGTLIGKAVSYSTSIEASEDNELYADNGVSESDKAFAGGTLTIGTDDLSQAASALILGITPTSTTIGTDTVSELIYDDNQVAPDLGYGTIQKKKIQGSIKWRGIVLPKIKFNIPEESYTTQGRAIEWQTPSITASIMRDDSTNHRWKREAIFDSEAAAEAYIKSLLNITDPSGNENL